MGCLRVGFRMLFAPSAILLAFVVSSASYSFAWPRPQLRTSYPLFNFDGNYAIDGFAITDKPKGGHSTILFQIINRTIVLTGTLLPSPAGVASVSYRIMNPASAVWKLSPTTEIVIHLVGDGNTYRFLVKDGAALDSSSDYSFQREFKTVKGIRQEVRMRLNTFIPYLRGIQMPDDVVMDTSEILQWGIQITSKTTGSFRLLISDIRSE